MGKKARKGKKRKIMRKKKIRKRRKIGEKKLRKVGKISEERKERGDVGNVEMSKKRRINNKKNKVYKEI